MVDPGPASPSATAWLSLLGLAFSTLVSASLGAYAWHRRSRSGALPFVATTGAMAVWAGAYGVSLVVHDEGARLLWENVQWFGIAFVPVTLLAFALEYTGHERFVTRRSVTALSVVPVVTVAAAWTNPHHGLLWTDSTVVVADGLSLVVQSFGPWYRVNLVYTYALVGLASFLLLRPVVESRDLFTAQSALLVAGVSVPLFANALSVLGLAPLPGLDLTPYAFAVTSLVYGVALFRHRLLDVVPATRRVGRRAVLDDLDDGVVVVDDRDRVVYCNDAAVSVFDADPGSVPGTPVDRLVGDGVDPGAVGTFTEGDATYEIRPSTLTDRRGRAAGYTLLVQDVTARERRKRDLRRQRDDLEHLDGINAVVRGVIGALVAATTREEVERAVCDRLRESGFYRSARMDDWSPDGAVVDGGTVDNATRVGVRPGAPEGESTTALDQFPGDESSPEDRVRSAEVSIAYGDVVHGSLVLESDRLDAFDESERAVLDDLGEVIGLATSAIGHRTLLQADSVVELRFRVTDPASFPVVASDRLDCVVELDGFLPAADGGSLRYLTVSGASPDEVLGMAADWPTVEGARLVRESDDGGAFEFILPEGETMLPLQRSGVRVRSARAEGGECDLVVEAPPGADVRALAATARESFPETELVAKSEVRRPSGADPTPRETLLDDLTDRQKQSIETAYRAGYFEWPRDSTAQEVAEVMGVSPPTFHHHFRRGQDRVFGTLFDAERTERE